MFLWKSIKLSNINKVIFRLILNKKSKLKKINKN